MADVRILLATPRFAPQVGGAETWTREVVAGLMARGHLVQVIARATGAAPDVALRGSPISGVAVRRVLGGRRAFSRAIIHEVAAQRPEVVLAQFSALAPAVVAGRRNRIAVVGIVHDVYGFAESVRIRGPLVGTGRHLGMEQSLRFLGPDGFLVPSHATARALAPLARGRPVTIVPAGADHVPKEAAGVERDPARVVFVGRLVPQKGAADLVEAVRILMARGRTIRAVVVGAGPQAGRLARLATGLPVRFAGSLAREELDRLVRGSAAMVMPSTREGWGLVVTEAAARGVAYVAYDIPAVREQHEELEGGILVPRRADALADAVASLLDDPDLARSLGGRGRGVGCRVLAVSRASRGGGGRAAAAGRTWAAAAQVVEQALEAASGRAR